MAYRYANHNVFRYTCNTMPVLPPVLLEMTALVLLVLFAAWYGPQIRRKKELQELSTLNSMYRYA